MTAPGAPAAAPAVELRGVQRRFGEVEAVRGLDLVVERGELYGLVGPDGAGKTTTVRLAAGLLDPDEGVVRVFGEDPRRGGVRERVGLMPQRASLYADLSVDENLEFFGNLYCIPRAEYERRRARLLEITRLGPFTDRRAGALSGGMYKKLALSCALLHEPEVLLLDEPTNGVDPVSRRELWALLHEFVAAGMTVVVCTPYMDEAERCGRVGLLARGRLVLEGRPGELLRSFEQEAWRATGPDVEALAAALEAEPAVHAVTPAGSGLRVVAERGAGATVEAVVRRHGGEIARARPSFEDLYLARAGGEGA